VLMFASVVQMNTEITIHFSRVCVCDRNGIKILLGTGAVYVTVNEGVWSTSERGLSAAQRLRTYVLPETTQYWDKVKSMFVSVKLHVP